VAIAASALQRKGVPASELSDHVIAVNVDNVVNVITRPDAITNAQWREARTKLEAQGFKILLGPDVAYDTVTSTLISGKADTAFFASLVENITPSTDDNPFFFTERFGTLLAKPAATLSNNNAAISMTLLLIVVAFCACAYYIVAPFVRLAKRIPLAVLTPPVTYFCAIGMGFMLIEISQMQRLMVFLGHPVYGLAVVLFTILLFSGLGSTTVGSHEPRPGAVIARAVALLTTLTVAGLLTPWLTTSARSAATDMRILMSVLLLAPPAFCMGMMFPLGLSVWRRHSELLPFFWSANGITSMFASVLGMALSITFGIANTYATGVAFYGVCAVMIVVSRAAHRLSMDDVASEVVVAAPSIQPALTEVAASIAADKRLEPTAPSH
jgi:hypothetical protein